jgi:hypothetical protein
MHRCSNVSKAVDLESRTAHWEWTQWLWRRFRETEVKPDFTQSESIFMAQIKSIIYFDGFPDDVQVAEMDVC